MQPVASSRWIFSCRLSSAVHGHGGACLEKTFIDTKARTFTPCSGRAWTWEIGRPRFLYCSIALSISGTAIATWFSALGLAFCVAEQASALLQVTDLCKVRISNFSSAIALRIAIVIKQHYWFSGEISTRKVEICKRIPASRNTEDRYHRAEFPPSFWPGRK